MADMNQRRKKNFSRRPRDSIPKPVVEWIPVTSLGKKVKEGKITDINQIFNSGEQIMEARIVDTLLPNLEEDLLFQEFHSSYYLVLLL